MGIEGIAYDLNPYSQSIARYILHEGSSLI